MKVFLLLAFLGLSLATNGTPTFTYNLSYSSAELDPCWKWSNQQRATTEENCLLCVEAVTDDITGETINCSYCPLQSICLSASVAEDYNGGGCWSIPINDPDNCAPPGSVGGIRAVSIYSAIIFIGLIAMGAKFWKTSADFKKKVAEAEREDEEPAAVPVEEEKPKKANGKNGKAAQRKTPKKEASSSSSSVTSSPASPSKETSGKETSTSSATSASSPKESSSVSSTDSS